MRSKGFYSYDAASDDEDPVKRWIGREVKRFLDEAHQHLPFLLGIAAAPADVVDEAEAGMASDGTASMAADDEFAPTPEELAAEAKCDSVLEANGDRWDRFLAYVDVYQKEWASEASDTDTFRKRRAVELFNAGALVATDLLELKPTMETWVPHIAAFIVPRQVLELGDPTRRSCDACESYGAKLKQRIKHLTCRRTLTRDTVKHTRSGGGAKTWRQTFTKGYIEQAFTRQCVSEALKHGPDNASYIQRKDARMIGKGRSSVKPESCKPLVRPSVRELMASEDS